VKAGKPECGTWNRNDAQEIRREVLLYDQVTHTVHAAGIGLELSIALCAVAVNFDK